MKKTREKSENKQKLVKENPSLEFFFSFQDPWTLNRNCDHHRDFRGEFTVGTRRDFSGSQFNSQEWVSRDFSPIFQTWILWWLGLDSLAVWTAAFARGLEFSKIFQEAQVLDFWARGLDRSVASAEYETKNEEFAIFKKLKLFPEFCPVLAIYFRWEPCIYLIYLFLFRLDAFLGSVFGKSRKITRSPSQATKAKLVHLSRVVFPACSRENRRVHKPQEENLSPVQSVCLFLLCLFTLLIMTWMKLELQKKQKNISFIWPFLAWIWFFFIDKISKFAFAPNPRPKMVKSVSIIYGKIEIAPEGCRIFFFHPTCFVQPPNAVVSKVFQGFGLGLGWPSLQDWYNVLFQLREQVEKRDCGSQTENSGFIFARK